MPIDAGLVAGLVADQFPQWAALPFRAASPQGWDNRTFRLGDELLARLPSGPGYAPQVGKEHRWLPRLAPHLPLAIPQPVAMGRPGRGYPFAWSIGTWLEGDVLSRVPGTDPIALARDLAAFLVALRAVPLRDGPQAGPLTAYRGGPLAHYADEARSALARLGSPEAAAAGAVFEAALDSSWTEGPVWFHGDVAPDNLLVRDGRLAAVLDFGCSGVGDPACDLVIAFTWFDAPARHEFRAAVGVDDATWSRGRGWAIWKSAITLTDPAATPDRLDPQARAMAAVLHD